jgi:hypothetical protein
MIDWITDRVPVEEDSHNGMVWTTDLDGSVIVCSYLTIQNDQPWMKITAPTPYRKPTWKIGTHDNILTDGEYFVIVSGSNFKHIRDKILQKILETLNKFNYNGE